MRITSTPIDIQAAQQAIIRQAADPEDVSGLVVWLASVEGRFATAGLYYATSRDLIHWSQAALLAATPMTHQPCGTGESNKDGWITSYPSVLDPEASGRNFDNVGDEPWLFYARIKNVGCAPAGERILMRQRVTISPTR